MRFRAAIAVGCVWLVAGCAGSSPESTATSGSTESTATTASTETTASGPTTIVSTTTTQVPRSVRAPSLGVGDALFPDLGSDDVDVESYDLHLTVPAAPGPVDATMIIDAEVASDIDVLALDAVGLDIEAITVDGEMTTFTQADPELLIDLSSERGESVTVEIEYRFEPVDRRSVVGLPIGWVPGDDGSYVLNEPDGARTWMPANDHPSDKATWRFEITAPVDRAAIANGALVRRGDADGPWVWIQEEPMSTYLVQLIVGDYDVVDGGAIPSSNGDTIPLTHVVPTGEAVAFAAAIDGIAEQVVFFEDRFGPYPLDRYGLAFVEGLSNLAMETQGRSMFGAGDIASGGSGPLGYSPQLLLSHELAHQWFGNAVSPATWSDIWLNESLTTYAHWLWLDHVGVQPLESYADAMLSQRQTGVGSTGVPTVDDMFGFNRYDGGAVVTHALRATMGDEAFFRLLTRWVGDRVGTAQTTESFIMLASEVHGADLTAFFDAWLFADTLPGRYP